MGNKQRRKSKSAAIYIPVAVLLVAFLTVYGISVFLKIVDIEVSGAALYTKEEIILASGIAMGDNMLFINSGSVQQRIYAAMPYINEVSVEISLPDIVRIRVIEAVPLASIKCSEGVLVIDTKCKILEMTDVAPVGLIEISGFTPADITVGNDLKAYPGDDTRLSSLKDVLAAIEMEGIYNDVSSIDVANIAYISFFYCGRFDVILGRPDNMQYKMNVLKEFIAGREAESSRDETGTIDMSVRGQWRYTPDR